MASLTSGPYGAPTGVSADPPLRRLTPWVNLWRQDDALTQSLLWALRIGVVLLFFTPLIVTTSTLFPFIVGKAIWSRSLIEIIAGIYVLLAIRAPEFRPTRSRLVMLFGLHLAAVFVAGVFGSSFNLSFWSSYERMGGIFDLAHWMVLAAVLVFTVRGLREWKVIASVSLIFGLASASLGLAEKYDYEVVNYLQGADRVSGAAGNPSFLAGHMMVNAMLALALLGDGMSKLRVRRSSGAILLMGFYAFAAAVSLWVLGETGTRGSAAGFLAGIVVAAALYAVYSGRPRLRLAAALVGAAVPIAVILLFLARDTAFVGDLADRNQVVRRALSVSLDGGSDDIRVTGLRVATQAVAARPLTGWGGENFEVPFQRYQRDGEIAPSAPILDRAHNKPLDLLATTGLIGFVSYMSIWAWLGVLAWRRVRDEPGERLFHVMVTGALLALFIHNLFLFDTAVTLLMFGLFAAWAAAGERTGPTREESGPSNTWLPASARRSLRWAAPVVVGLVVVAGVYGVNWRIYRAAQVITETGADVQAVSTNMSYFSPLATFARERLLNIMAERWEEMDRFDRIDLVKELEREAGIALDAEPENMELRFAVARFYRAAALDLPDLMALARTHTDRGIELGPHTASAVRALTEQAEAEEALAAAG